MKFKLISTISALAILGGGSSLIAIPAIITQTNNVSNEINNNAILETSNIKHSENVQVVNALNEVEIVDVAGVKNSFGAIINNNGKQEIYMWGYNNYGQLGLGDTTNRLVPTLLDSSKLGNYKLVKELTLEVGVTKVVVDTDNGEQIYAFGYNANGQLGIGNTTNQLTPVLFDTTIFGNYTSIKEIYFTGLESNASYAIILDNKGDDKIFVWGNNNNGKLGIGNASAQSTPLEFDTTKFGTYVSIREFKINAYGSYAILVREDGKNELYMWGRNTEGQLGIGSTTDEYTPRKVNAVSGQNIKFLKLSLYTVFMVVTNNGIDQLYTWGNGGNAQLIQGSSPGNISTPRAVAQSSLFNATEIIQINGYISMFASVKINGELRFITWGHNSYGEVMVGSTNTTWIPVLIDNSKLGNFTEVYDSVYTSDINSWNAYSCYAYVKTASGDKLYVWGENSSGQLGAGSTSNVYWPVEAKGFDLSTAKITKFPKNFSNSNILRLAINNKVEYFGTGLNSSGQLASNNTNNLSTFTKMLPTRYTNPTSRLVNSKLTAIEALNLINSNNTINLNELEKYVDTTSFPIGSALSIDIAKTTTNLEQGILNLAITTNKYNSPLILDTFTGSKTFEVAIQFLKATNINTNPVFVKETLFSNQDEITIEKLYSAICNSAGKVMNRPLLEQYMDLTSIPPSAQLYLLANSLDNPLQATFTLKSNEVYSNGITTPLDYIQQDLIISLQDMTNWALIISLSVVGGVLIIAALIAFILIKRNSNRIII